MAGLKLLTVADARRQADARARRAAGSRASATSTPCSRGSSRSPSPPSSARVYTLDEIARAGRPRARAAACCCTSTARGWPTPPRRSTSPLRAIDHRRRRRRALASAARRTGCWPARRSCCSSPALGRRLRLPAQAVDAARLEDALRRRAVRRAARAASCGCAAPAHANAMAARLAAAVARRPRRRGSPSAVQANAVFAVLPPGRRRAAAASACAFYVWDERPARCAGCARGTRRRPTSTRSPPTWRPRLPTRPSRPGEPG